MSTPAEESGAKEDPFVKELNERSLPDSMKTRLKEINVTSIANLRNLNYEELKKNFDNNESVKASPIEWKHLKAMWSGDETFPKDYTPPIRKQLMESNIDPAYADFYESQGIFDLGDVSEDMLGKASAYAKESLGKTEQESIQSDIMDMRSGTARIKNPGAGTSSQTNFTSFNDDEKMQSQIQKSQFISGEIDKLQGKAKEVEDSITDALNNLETEKDAGEASKKLKEVLTSLKGQVVAPSDMDEVGKHFKGIAAVDSLDKKALFDTTTHYGKSFDTEEDFIAYANGGQALCGFYISLKEDTMYRSMVPALAKPSRVECYGVTSPSICKIVKFTSESESQAFLANATTYGVSSATEMHTTATASASIGIGGFGFSASGGYGRDSKTASAEQDDRNQSKYVTNSCSSVQLIEYLSIPMQSYRLPRTEMKLSDEAIFALQDLTNEIEAQNFLEEFGSHVTKAKRTYGGIFFRKISLTSASEMNANKMFAMAGEHLSETKKQSTEASAGGFGIFSGGMGGAAASVKNSKGETDNVDNADAKTENKSSAENECTYQCEVRTLGTKASTTQDFFKTLNQDNSNWVVIDTEWPDSKRLNSFVPIWKIIEKHRHSIQQATVETSNMKSNREIADLLRDAWYKNVDDESRKIMESGRLISSVLKNKEEAFKNKEEAKNIFKSLSEKIFACGGELIDKDEDDLDALKKVVESAASLIAKSDEPPQSQEPNDWIKNFLESGCGSLDSDDEKGVLSRFLRAYSNNPKKYGYDKDCHKFATDGRLEPGEWDLLPEIFYNHLDEKFKSESTPRFADLPSHNVRGVYVKDETATFFSGTDKKCYEWDLHKDKFIGESNINEKFKYLFAMSSGLDYAYRDHSVLSSYTAYGWGTDYSRSPPVNIGGLDPKDDIDAVVIIPPDTLDIDHQDLKHKALFFAGPRFAVWDMKKNKIDDIGNTGRRPVRPRGVMDLPDSGINAVLITDQQNVFDYLTRGGYIFYNGSQRYRRLKFHNATDAWGGEWDGITSDDYKIDFKIDAVFTYPERCCPYYARGIAYFFSGDNYYLFDLVENKLFSKKCYPISRK